MEGYVQLLKKTKNQTIYIKCHRYQAGVLSGHSNVCQFLETYPSFDKDINEG